MAEHAVAQQAGLGIHHHQRVIGTGRANIRMALRDGRAVTGTPAMRLLAEEAIDHRKSRTAMGVPAYRVAERQHVEGVKAQHGSEPVIIALGRMDGLGSAHFFGRLSGEAQATRDPVSLHGRSRGQEPTQRRHAQGRMRIGMAGSVDGQPFSRPRHPVGRLAIAGYGIIFGIHADHGARAVRPLGTEGGGHAARPLLHRETLGAQSLDIPGGRAIFPPGRLGEIEDHGAVAGQPIAMGSDVGESRIGCGGHVPHHLRAIENAAIFSPGSHRSRKPWREAGFRAGPDAHCCRCGLL